MPAALFISWVRHHGRSEALAAELGADPVFIAVGRSGNRLTGPARYAAQSLLTVALLLRRRPRVVVCMAPPDLLVRVLLLWRRAWGGRLVVDAHSDAVLQRDGVRTRPSFVRLAARVDAVIVTNTALAGRLTGAHVVVLGDPPEVAAPGAGSTGAPLVVFPASWAFDEPIEQVVEAARQLPGYRVVITGRADGARVGQAPTNLELPGFLPAADYLDLLARAHAVLALTTRPETMQRAAYEALDRSLPVVATDTPVLRELLGTAAAYAGPDARSLATALRHAVENGPALRAGAVQAQARRRQAHEQALGSVRALLSG